MKTILHLIIDPMCGWTYAAAPLMAASLEKDKLLVQVHGGGMLAGNNRKQITPDWRGFVMPMDKRIAEVSGQSFGSAYTDGLLNDTSVILDSAPATTAVLVAQDLVGEGITLLNQIQRGYYQNGQK